MSRILTNAAVGASMDYLEIEARKGNVEAQNELTRRAFGFAEAVTDGAITESLTRREQECEGLLKILKP